MAAENVSRQLSGETMLGYYYLQHLTALGHEVLVTCHERVKDQLESDLGPEAMDRFTFVKDRWDQRLLHRMGRFFPYRIEDLVFNQLIQIITQIRMRKIARDIVARERVDVVFQPVPIASRAVSFLHDVGAPVVIGPMSGGMDLPPAFRHMDRAPVRFVVERARSASRLLHRLFPGKLKAAALLVANDRTRAALPPGITGTVHTVMESAVELDRWQPRTRDPALDGEMSYIFCSRFVDWKGIAYLVRAFAPLARERKVRLDLIGDGELFENIRALVQAEGIEDSVVLHGRQPVERYMAMLPHAGAFVTPSLRECGGIAMMEAMAIGVPVIGTDWGGQAQYAGPDCALLVPPTSEAAFIDGLTDAMRRLADSPELRARLGAAGRRHLEDAGHDWRRKAAVVADILHDVVARAGHRRASAPALHPTPLSSTA